MSRKPVLSNPPRFQPTADPSSIQIPGLDTTASVNDQIDQIEQLITFKLQNIDENFSKIQNILSTRLLPAVKRYAAATAPVREAAQFWTSFYEEAAQINIQTYEGQSSLQETTNQSEIDSHPSPFSDFAVSSTPAPALQHQSMHHLSGDVSGEPSAAWQESPLVLLERGVRSLTQDEHVPPTPPRVLATPQQPVFHLPRFTTPRTITRKKPAEESADESFDGLPPGMSPPRMMSPAAPPRSSAELGLLKLALSPVKDAAERIKLDLLSDVQKQSGGSRLLYSRAMHGKFPAGVESSMSTVPTPPSLSRYTRHEGYGFESSHSSKLDSSLESVMHRVGLGTPAGGTQYEDEDGDISLSIPLPLEDRDFDLDSDSDSDEIHDTAHPSQAFLLASQQNARRASDDSDDSLNQSLDSLNRTEIEEGLRIGSAEFVDDFEDSLDADGAPEEGTVFGLPPAQREAVLHDMRQSGLRLFGANLAEDTIGVAQRRVTQGTLDETPTPWARVSHG